MSDASIDITKRSKNGRMLKHGILIGLAGGAAEVAVVWCYAAATGTDAGAVASGVAASFGVPPGIGAGIAIHMLLAASLGAALYAVLQVLPERAQSFGALPFMLGSLAAVWAINFLAVLPAVNPSFVHMLPYDATLASKLAFGAVAAAMLRSMERRRMPNRAVARQRGDGADYRPDAPPAEAVSGGRAAVALVAGHTPGRRRGRPRPERRIAPFSSSACKASCSCCSPPVSTATIGLPPPSARKCSLVENSPWLCPNASTLYPFPMPRAGGYRLRADARG